MQNKMKGMSDVCRVVSSFVYPCVYTLAHIKSVCSLSNVAFLSVSKQQYWSERAGNHLASVGPVITVETAWS